MALGKFSNRLMDTTELHAYYEPYPNYF